ncbi:endonuclease/exonuclease/phosphatase family protein [Pacificimonas sp. WHA3]|uniref:Endonuclease/exonuclease/phosphatase family protein n=1 Tax=Pacificimonas pallii TaxID=2827236 RepID=A0ABS6SHL1_9SPHN|nr:endonuclease/exonuclease/phosphatase family protein [Pacificimonas pallii]MBV7257908.1 endonuclease/exonuclease/phosphatase family protein [Pacificimonas pallii]
MLRSVITWLVRAVVMILALATLLPLISTDEWWVRAMEFPRVQIAALLFLSGGVLFALGWRAHWAGIAVAALAFAYQAVRIAPYAALAPVQAASIDKCPADQQVTILMVNVLQTNRDTAPLLALLAERDPDIILAVETDRFWTDALAPATAAYPHQRLHPLDNTYGMALYSRMPVGAMSTRFMVEPDIPSIAADVTLPGGAAFRLFAIHPRPPIPGKDSGPRDAELVLTARDVARSPLPAIVAGDLNDVAWSDTTRLFQELSGTLDPRIGRGYFATYNAKVPLARWPLDHIFFTPEFGLVSFERLGKIGSDHFPVTATLCLAPAVMEDEQTAPTADAETIEDAAEQLSEGRAQQAEEMAEGEDETQTAE